MENQFQFEFQSTVEGEIVIQQQLTNDSFHSCRHEPQQRKSTEMEYRGIEALAYHTCECGEVIVEHFHPTTLRQLETISAPHNKGFLPDLINKRGETYMDMENINWTTLTPGVWKPEKPGDHIAGILTNKPMKNDKVSARYYIKSDGKIFLLWGSAVLDHRLSSVEPGTPVRITYLGLEKNSNNQNMKMFEVEVPDTEASTGTDTTDWPVPVETIGDSD